MVEALTGILDTVAERSEVNDITAVFLISDFNDTCNNDSLRLLGLLSKKQAQAGTFRLHCFPFGDQINQETLAEISVAHNAVEENLADFYDLRKQMLASLSSYQKAIASSLNLEFDLEEGVKIVREMHPLNFKQKRSLSMKVPVVMEGEKIVYMIVLKCKELEDEVPVMTVKLNYQISSKSFSLNQTFQIATVWDEKFLAKPN